MTIVDHATFAQQIAHELHRLQAAETGPWLSVAQIADYTSLSKATVLARIHDGTWAGRWITPRRVVVARGEIDGYLARCRTTRRADAA